MCIRDRPLTEEALETAKNSDAVLLGAVGGNVGNSRWYDVAPNLRPEAGLLAIRKGLNLFANIRPAYLYQELADACPLKKEIIGDGFDMVIMREDVYKRQGISVSLYRGCRRKSQPGQHHG